MISPRSHWIGNNNQISQDSIAPISHRNFCCSGVRVSSTLDANMQRFNHPVLRSHLLALDGRNVMMVRAIVIDNKSGEVLAYVGSSGSMSEAADVDGVTALRQAGSTLKPFLYGMAIENRQLTAASVLGRYAGTIEHALGFIHSAKITT